MAHRVRYVVIENDPRPYVARCRCGQRSPQCTKRQHAEDWWVEHQFKVEQLRASLNGQPSLSSTRDYYLSMASDPNQPPEHRELWQRLADEITRRLNDGAPMAESQGELF